MPQKKQKRLADPIFAALQLAVEQKDVAIADLLARALEMSMTRKAGGKDFVERREFTQEAEELMSALDALKKSSKKA